MKFTHKLLAALSFFLRPLLLVGTLLFQFAFAVTSGVFGPVFRVATRFFDWTFRSFFRFFPKSEEFVDFPRNCSFLSKFSGRLVAAGFWTVFVFAFFGLGDVSEHAAASGIYHGAVTLGYALEHFCVVISLPMLQNRMFLFCHRIHTEPRRG